MSARTVATVLASVLGSIILATTIVAAVAVKLAGDVTALVTVVEIDPVTVEGPEQVTSKDQVGTVEVTPESVRDSVLSYNNEVVKDSLTVLVMGSDSRVGKGNKGYGPVSKFGTSERSDTTILLHLNGDGSAAFGVSIPRDTIVNLPECAGGGVGRFNSAMSAGGPACTVQAARDMSGLAINHFLVVDFGAFKEISEAVGGVPVCLPQDVNDADSGLVLAAGEHLLEGEQALAYVRTRKGLGDGSDISRITRQQEFLKSMAGQLTQEVTNPVQAYQVVKSVAPHLTTDPYLADLRVLTDLALKSRALKSLDIVTLPWVLNPDKATVSVDQEQAQRLWEHIGTDLKTDLGEGEGGKKSVLGGGEKVSVC